MLDLCLVYLFCFVFTAIVFAWCAPKAPSYKSDEWVSWIFPVLLGGALWPLAWFVVVIFKVMMTSERKAAEERLEK